MGCGWDNSAKSAGMGWGWETKGWEWGGEETCQDGRKWTGLVGWG